MRLTLRTMLAYLDDILDPGDATELSRKIEESKFAGELVHRIRNSTRRLRLGAPRPEGKGMGLDPNTVAEYLDNTLPHEHVPDFEKVCLESDVHLAEVASCHQILTLVLGEPAEVEQAIRRRIYGVAGEATQAAIDQPHEPLPHVGSVPGGEGMSDDVLGLDTRTRVQLPTNRHASGFPLKSLAVTVVLAFLLALVGLRAMGEFNASHPLWRLIDGSSSQLAQEDLPAAQAGGRGEDAPPVTTAAVDPDPEVADGGRGTPLADREPDPAAVDSVQQPNANSTDVSAPRAAEGSEEMATGTALTENATAAVTLPPNQLRAPVVDPGPTSVVDSVPDSESIPELPAAGIEAIEPIVPAAPAEFPNPSEPVTVGRFISEEHLLARQDARGDWYRLPAESPLFAGDQLVVLPTYRPQILLQSGPKVTVAGATNMTIKAPVSSTVLADIPCIAVAFGRALVIPVGEESSAIQLEFGGRQATLQFAGKDSAIAVDVRNYRPPGSDPRAENTTITVRLYVLGGEAQWSDRDGNVVDLQLGQMLTVLGDHSPSVHLVEAPPDWIQSNNLRPIERRAAHDLLDHLPFERRLILSLMEQVEIDQQRKVEVRALANRSLMTMDIYDTVLETLEDERHRAYWADYFISVTSAIRRGPASSAKLAAAVAAAEPEERETIFRLMNGYTPDQLQLGAAEELVGLLEHPRMSIRVLAYLNLKTITEMTHSFQPFQKVTQNRGAITKWSRSLAEGRVVYRTEPSPFPELVEDK